MTSTPVRTAPRATPLARSRALLEREHVRAGLLLGVVVLVYLGPALLGVRMLSPAVLLDLYAPWRGGGSAGPSDLINPALFDVPASFQPWRELARELVHDGVFPAWNPYALGGTPLFANPEVAWLSPFTVLSWILPLNWSLGLVAALKLWAAGFGTYLLVRELRLGFWPGVLAGVSFAFCAFNVVWLAHGVQVSVAVTLPWLILLIERIVRTGSPRAGIALAIVSALAFSGGHPGTQLHVMTAAALYAVARTFVSTAAPPRADRLRRLGIVTAGLAIGALLLAATLVPGALNAEGTIGAQVRAHGGPTLPGSTLTPTALRTAMFPDWWGRPGDLRFQGPANYNERTFYAGAVALLLAGLALTSAPWWRRTLPFGVLGLLGLAVPLHAPGLSWLASHLPLYSATQNQRLLLLFMFAVAVLAAFGLQLLLERPREQGDAWSIVGVGAAIGLIGIVAAPEPESVLWWLIAVAGIAAALLVVRMRPRAGLAVAAGVAALAALDMLVFAHGYQPMVEAERATPPATEAIRYLQRRTGERRIAGLGLALPPDVSTLFGLRDARGYDAPQPSVRFFRLWRLANPRQDGWRPFDVRRLTPAGLNVLSVLGAGMIVREPASARGSPEQPGLGSLVQAYRGRDAVVLENPRALPRAFVAPTVRVVTDERAALARIRSERFDPRREVLVERGEVGAAALAGGGPNRGDVRLLREDNDEVVLRSRMQRRGLVVLDDSLTPGWKVRVDGRPAAAVRVDSVLRGAVVPAGTHTITWSYSVPGLRTGVALSAIGLAALGAWCLLLLRGRRPRAAVPSPTDTGFAAGGSPPPGSVSKPAAPRRPPPRPSRRRRR